MPMTTWWHPGRTVSFESGAPLQGVTSGIIAVTGPPGVSLFRCMRRLLLWPGVSPVFVMLTTLVTAFGHKASMRTVGCQGELFRW